MAHQTVLVTGAGGFIAGHTIVAFLDAGWAVRGTVRDLGRADVLRAAFAKQADVSKLDFVEADLLADDGWDDAVAGCDCVAHVASPFPLRLPKDENMVIRPAVEGSLRVLEAAARHGTPRVVQTSSIAAVIPGHGHARTAPFTEDDWADLDGPGIGAYVKSKTMAERAARDFVARQGSQMHLSTVNPGLVLGPLQHPDIGTSVELIQMILRGKYPGAPRVMYGAVDVRDVAKMHVLAAETAAPSGGRYFAVASVVSMIDLFRALKAGLGDQARKVPVRQLPNWLVRLVALVDAPTRQIVSDLGKRIAIDDSRTRAALKPEPFIPVAEAAVATARSLIDMKLV